MDTTSATRINLPLALRRLFPRVNGGAGPLPSLDYHARGDVIADNSWHPRWTLAAAETYPARPTTKQIADALAPNAGEQAREAAKAAFGQLSPGKQALWEPVRAAVDAALVAGAPARAVEIIQSVPAIYDGMEDDRAAFLALFTPPA